LGVNEKNEDVEGP